MKNLSIYLGIYSEILYNIHLVCFLLLSKHPGYSDMNVFKKDW